MVNSLVLDYLNQLYPSEGVNVAEDITNLIHEVIRESTRTTSRAPVEFTERDAILISYADQVLGGHRCPLEVLGEFLSTQLEGVFTTIHLLPFYPSTSDDGFAVKNYAVIDPSLGEWSDVTNIQRHFRVMYDAVINHVSSDHPWFRSFLDGDPEYENFFITDTADFDTSNVVRPRGTPLFHTYAGEDRAYRVWTTFSADQIDLNFRNPRVLVACLRILMLYAQQGASIIRLDAIGYVWKESGTTCLNQPNAHVIVKLIREVFNQTFPNVALITETNVPHDENIEYFGDGSDEAQLVYQFTLPPLVLYACLTGDATPLTRWAGSLEFPEGNSTFFNFLASHDGIGVMPAKGYLTEAELRNMVESVRDRGGLVSVRDSKFGPVPYEINSTWYSAISRPDEPVDIRIDKFVVSYAIALSFRGVPGVYFHSMFGTVNDSAGFHFTNRARSVNRRKLQSSELESAFNTPASLASQIFARITALIRVRCNERLFSPRIEQRVLQLSDSIFGVIREHPSESARLLCLHNVTGSPVVVPIQSRDVASPRTLAVTNLITGEMNQIRDNRSLTLEPYGFVWLRLEEDDA